MKLIDKYKAIQKIGTDVEVPYHVWRLFGDQQRLIQIVGDQICLGEDYESLEMGREAIEWYVDQLGGSVTWKK